MLVSALILTLLLEIALLVDYVFTSGKFFCVENRKMLRDALLICAVPFFNAILLLMILYTKSRK